MVSVNSLPANLLVVGNEPAATHPFRQWLEPSRYAVKFASNTEQALQDIHQSIPDLVLLNPALNGSGLQVCSTIKEDESLGFVPVIVLLETESGPAEAAFESGADEVLVEPIQKAELLAHINGLLRIKRRFDTLQNQNQVLTHELAKRTQELEFALRESQALGGLKDSIVTNVSHELKTPLLQVKSAVAMLAEDARIAGNGVSVLADHATAATARLESVIQNITQLASTLNVKSEPFFLVDAVKLALRQLGRQWASSGGVERIKVNINNVPMVMGDRGGVAQVLQQLLDNAIKFSPNGGPVEIFAERYIVGIRISVRDRGIGIPADHLERIFQAFYQVDSSTTRHFGGMGVGLAIVKLLLDRMGTVIQVESQPNVGSTFSFVLPIADQGSAH
jgi:signal transduction histidine kinase